MIILVGCLLAKKEKETETEKQKQKQKQKQNEKVTIMSECNHVIISRPRLKLGLSASPHVSEHWHTSSSGNLLSEHHTLPMISGTSLHSTSIYTQQAQCPTLAAWESLQYCN